MATSPLLLRNTVQQELLVHVHGRCISKQTDTRFKTTIRYNTEAKYTKEFTTCRTLKAKEFIANARQSSGERQMSIITCSRGDSVKDIILKLDAEKRQRIYVINDEGNLDGLITLRDIIAKLVYEPPGYFGDFFNGVIPLPQNSRV